MSKRPLAGLAVGIGCLALSLSVGAGVVSAIPDVGPMVNTTCTYDQAMRAVHAENPMAAQYLDQSPPNLQFLRTFMASTPDERLNLLKAIRNNPGADQAFPIFRQMMISCKNY
ncbi:hemophore-related protein [Mycobacterium tilburgii]|uniref:hemophore-related protein n=1 Tax=Mycobacterium tilburgii TaxID=44467 RepID=UPI0011837E82|nr:hemophore-related protein [Mycobacterium tilburgii]